MFDASSSPKLASVSISTLGIDLAAGGIKEWHDALEAFV
jgi:hypothetical protein